MVEAAKMGKPPPTDEYRVYMLCQLFNCTPSQMLKEDGIMIDNMINDITIHRAVKKRRESSGDAIHDLPDHVHSVLDMLDEMDIRYDGLS